MAVAAQDDRLMLAEAVTRRICHDLAGLVGTLGGTLELAGDDPEAAALAIETAGALAARLRLLRGAWSGGVEGLDATALQALLPGLPHCERLRLDARALAAPLDGTAGRLCLCLLLVAGFSLPKGGSISIGCGGGAVWVELDGSLAAWPASLQADGAAAWPGAGAPSALPAAMCRLLAAASGWSFHVGGQRVTAVPN